MTKPGKTRSTRKLRNWMIEQVSSGKFPGLMWDDPAKTMFRIPWKHASKQDFRSDEDAAIFKAWADFKGKQTEEGRFDPAICKTRLRCALNKSPEFREVSERSQLDISEPYKVYRLVPMAEQELVCNEKKTVLKTGRRTKRKAPSEDDDKEEENEAKLIKEEAFTPQPISMTVQSVEVESGVYIPPDSIGEPAIVFKGDVDWDNEIHLNLLMETTPPNGDLPSLIVSVYYVGQEVLKRTVFARDVRIAYYTSSPNSTSPPSLCSVVTERIVLPEPPSSLSAEHQKTISALLPFMEKGVLLASTGMGILAQRYCQGRVYWQGPHTTQPGLHKLERTTDPVVLFNREAFMQELIRCGGGVAPQCGITLCFGEELTDTDDPASKLITIKISLPWASQQIQGAQSVRESLAALQGLASQSPLGEVTLNLIAIP